VLALALASVALAAAAIVLPAVLGKTFDAVIGGGDETTWLLRCGLVIAVLVICDTLDDLAFGAATARSTAWLRRRVLDDLLARGTRVGERFGPGEVSSRIVGNTAEAGMVPPNIVRAATNLLPALGGIVALAVIDPWLCVTFLIGAPLLILFVRAFARDASEVASRYFAVQGRIASRLVDALSGARTIAAAGTADREAKRVLAPLPQLHRHGMGIWRAQTRIATQDVVLVSLLEVAVLAVAGAQLARGRISPGEMLAASQYVLLAGNLSSAIPAVTRLARGRGAAARLVEMTEEPPVAYGSDRIEAGQGRIEFRDVTVERDGERVLDRLNLVVPGGALVAVVGPSGAGKSLLAAVAGRLLDPDEGEVVLDGVPLPDLSRDALRREVGFGFERPALMGDTIADAIAFGGEVPPTDDVVAAARAARADGFIRKMPHGYGTPLAEAPMSGGEVQRIGLARTFAHARRVVILDDVAASLDTVTEHHIGEVLMGALSDRTRILVAHRASTAARADAVIWLEAGRTRAIGTHDELWGDPGYRALFQPDAAERQSGTAATNGRPA
jgi:ATP-binding cassette subfamily B protein